MKRMVQHRQLSWVAAVAVAGIAVLVLTRAVAESRRPVEQTTQPQTPNNRAWMDPFEEIRRGKAVTIDASQLPDIGKYFVEWPTKQLLTAKSASSSAPPTSEFVNPKVKPGKVRWHKTFTDACAAAKKSGKPVLLFQMMGKLDERFC